MKLTFLGTGTSQGVPIIGCRCRVCTSADRRDRRLRTSAMIECGEVRLVIDAGPDFRYQMLRTGVRHIDAILLTHEHKDHIGGLDDVRAFNFVDFPVIHRIDLYGTEHVLACVRKDFDYAFAADKYRGVPEIELRTIVPGKPFRVKGVEVVPVSGHHSERFEVTGFRIGKLAYLIEGVKEFRSVHGIPLQILADGKAFDLESLMALIFNGETAGGFHLAPRSSIKDGMFDCLLLQRRNMLFSVVSMLRHLLGGRPSQVKHFRARTLDITSPINEPTDVDGQKGADFPLHIECLHNELRVVCPLSEAPRRGRFAYFKNLISKLAWWRTR